MGSSAMRAAGVEMMRNEDTVTVVDATETTGGNQWMGKRRGRLCTTALFVSYLGIQPRRKEV